MLSFGCNDKRLVANEQFIKKYGRMNFDRFLGHWAVYRGSENDDQIIFIIHRSKDSSQWRVVVNEKTHTVDNLDRLWGMDSSKRFLDTKLISEMALFLDNCDIASLWYDPFNNVYVTTNFLENGPKLARFRNNQAIPENQKELWKEKRDGWWEYVDYD
jgi:hypothetical protein